jgi:pyridoxine 5-phosphate synthase
VGNFDRVKAACAALGESGIEVSLFIDADTPQIEAAVRAGAPVVELHTGHYADAFTSGERLQELERLRVAAQRAASLGLVVNAGHGLHYHNVADVCRIPEFRELNIGHSIIARALFSGLDQAVRDMKSIMETARAAASIDPA